MNSKYEITISGNDESLREFMKRLSRMVEYEYTTVTDEIKTYNKSTWVFDGFKMTLKIEQ